MTKTVETTLDNHMQQTTTTLAFAWRITRLDGKHFYFTSHDQDLIIDMGAGFIDGFNVYKARNSYRATSLVSSADLDVDHMTVESIFDMSDVDEDEMRRGLFDYADIHYFLVNWADISQGIMRLRRGRIGEVSILSSGIFTAELRGLNQGMRQNIVWAYTRDCGRGVDLGDSMCKVPIFPDEVLRKKNYAVGEFVRASNSTGFNRTRVDSGTNLGFETGDLTGWTTNSGTPSVEIDKLGILPIEGSELLTSGTGTSWEVEQNVDFSTTTGITTAKIDNGDYTMDMSVRLASIGGVDNHLASFEFLDSVDALLSTIAAVSGDDLSQGNDWATFEAVSVPVPVNARKVRVKLGATEVSDAGDSSVCYDDVQMYIQDKLDTNTILSYAGVTGNPRLEMGGGAAGGKFWNIESGSFFEVGVKNWANAPVAPGNISFAASGVTSGIFSIDDYFSTTDIDNGDIKIIIPVRVGSEDNADSYRFEVEALDAGNALIRYIRDTGTVTIDAANNTWLDLSVETILPPLTRNIRLTFFSVGSGANEVAFDMDYIVLEHQQRTATASSFDDRIYEVTTAGTTHETNQPVFDTVIGNTTTDGTVVFTAREGWSRAFEVTAVDGTDPRRKFTVTELTPNSGGTTVGQDYFPDDAMNGGVVTWETGGNAGKSQEVKDFVADDGITITQDIELHLTLPADIQVQDKGRIHRGCDKRRETCRDIFANFVEVGNPQSGLRHHGFPDVPGTDFVTTYPDAKVT